ncbi:MAG TPA: tRNA pseudouridine(55) synthase TruB [Steroidobacteraceae bacterium]|nr:tRNA pseudouridine(55) synthase TruB [Steroidobacteraceae bacterium]
MPSGILLLDKPHGLSSNAALQRVRALYARVKAGHVGSLDPLATGMLPICLGEATKIAGDLLEGRKCYRFTIALGAATSTGDAEGEVTQTAAVPQLGAEAVEAVLAQWRGARQQVPPMYSAIKRGGQPLYRLARQGVSVPRSARAIEISELTLVHLDAAALELETVCSKGTYVRVLAEDIARALGTCGHVAALRRLWVEPFAAQPMQTLEALAASRASEGAPPLLAIDWPLQHLPRLELDADAAERLVLGRKVATGTAPAHRVRVYDSDGNLMALGEVDAAGMLQPRRLIHAEE